MKNIFLNDFIFPRLVEIKTDGFSLFGKFEKYFIHVAVRYSSALATVRCRYFPVSVIKTISKIFSSANVENFIIENPQINSGDFGRVNMKSAERSFSELVMFVMFLSDLRKDFNYFSVFITIRNKILHELKRIAEQ